MQSFNVLLFESVNAGASVSYGWIAFARFVSEWLPALLCVLFALAVLCRPPLRPAFWLALASLLIAWGLVNLFRWAVPVPRPASLGLGIQWLQQGVRASFPSMHAAGAFALAFVLLLAGPRWLAVFALAMALLISWSRVFLGLHFPADVLGGMCLGGLVAVAVHQGWERGWRRGGCAMPFEAWK